MNYDEYQWPGLSLTQTDGIIHINLKDTSLIDLQKYYEGYYCGIDFSNPNKLKQGVFSANISISVVDVDGQVLKQYKIPYIKGKFEYNVVYTSNRAESINVVANVQITNGRCGQRTRYYSPVYENSNPTTSSEIRRTFNTVMKTSPTMGLAYGPWRFDLKNKNFLGGVDTFYHTLEELPYNYYDVKGINPKNVFNWPDSIYYKVFVDFEESSGTWTNLYSEETISESTYKNFENVFTFEQNTVMELMSNDRVSWTGQYFENFYRDGKGQFIALRAIDSEKLKKLLAKVGNYRIYSGRYDANGAVGISNICYIDVITTEADDVEADIVIENSTNISADVSLDDETLPPVEEDEIPIPTTYKFNESAYFKHTNGEAFLLNGIPYYGFFHILNGVAYVGKTHLESQTKLERKNTLIADIFLKGYHFNTCFKNFQNISENAQVDVFEFLNIQGINTLIDEINNNNIKCYRNLVIQNPTIYNFLDNGNHFYGLSTLEQETRYKWNTSDQKWKNFKFTFGSATLFEPIEIGLPAKNTYSHIRPFSKNKTWTFLANIKMGTIFLGSNDDFKYLCSDGRTTYILNGNFSASTPLKFVSSEQQTTTITNIYNDYSSNRVFFVKQDAIEVYDSSAFINCNNLILIDKLSPNTANTESIKFGKNIRSSLSGSTLGFYNKYSNQKYYDLDLSKFGIKNIIDLDIREVDDNIIILYKLNTGIYVCFFDPNNIENTYFNKRIEELKNNNSKIEFSKIDSDIFHIYNQKEYQTRSLNFPEYPNGRLEKGNLLYHDFQYKWGEAKQVYNYMDIFWNIDLDSNTYNSYLNSSLIRNNYMYAILHNNGRIYSIKQPVNDRYLTAIPLNLEKMFSETQCSQSSFGLYLNSMIINIVKDILGIYNKTSNTFKFTSDEVFYDKLKDLLISGEDLNINGNETINVLVLRRILTSIIDIQKNLLPAT